MNFLPWMVTVCPALWPPEYRATSLNRSERTSTILPLPSSPHWAPTTTAVLPIFNLLLHLQSPVERQATAQIRTQLASHSASTNKIRGDYGETGRVTLDSTGCHQTRAMRNRVGRSLC